MNIIENLSFSDNRKYNELEIRQKPKKTEIDFDLILKQKINNSFSYKKTNLTVIFIRLKQA